MFFVEDLIINNEHTEDKYDVCNYKEFQVGDDRVEFINFSTHHFECKNIKFYFLIWIIIID